MANQYRKLNSSGLVVSLNVGISPEEALQRIKGAKKIVGQQEEKTSGCRKSKVKKNRQKLALRAAQMTKKSETGNSRP